MKKLLFTIACALASFSSVAQLVGPQPWLFTGPQITIGGSNKLALLFGMSGSPINLSKGGTGTFARASTATVTDWEGIVRNVNSGEMRMSGWRRVENLVVGSDAPSTQSITVTSGRQYQARIGAGSAEGATVVFSGAFSGTLTGVAGSSITFTSAKTATTGSVTATITGGIANLQVEDVTGQANQTTSEYVSSTTGSPYHGLNVAGVKAFATTNGITVDGSGVITEAAGVALHPTYYEPAFKASVWAVYKPWAASESTLSLGSRRIPSQTLFPAGGNGYWYYVSTFVGASTGATEPTWPTTIGATVVDATGNTWTNGGYYRIDGYLAEPQRTNLGRFGNDPTNATYWANVDSTPTLNSVQSPDGRTTSTLITEGSAGTAIIAQSIKTVSAGSRQCMGVWLKRGNTDWVEVGMRNTGATNGFRVWVNLATGVRGTANTFGTATNEAAYVEMKGLNSHWRVVLCGKLAGGDTTAQPYVRSATADGTSTRVTGATYYTWRMQHVANDSIASDIPNDGAADISRTADALTYPGNALLNTSGAVLVSFRTDAARYYTAGATPQAGVTGISGDGRFFYKAVNSDRNRLHVHDGTNVVTLSATPVDRHSVGASAWGGTTLRISNQNNIASGTFDGSMAAGVINVGAFAGAGTETMGSLRSVVILTRPPTDAALQAATQWHDH